MKKPFLFLSFLLLIIPLYAQHWIPDPQKKYCIYPVNSYGSCLISTPDTLYIGGSFLRISNSNTRWAAKYCNGNWYPLGGGVDGIKAMVYSNGNLFVSSMGSASNSIDSPYIDEWGTEGLSRWESSSGLWKPIGNNSTTGGGAYAIEYYDNKIFAAGNFNAVGNTWVYQNPAYFNGWNWFKAGYNVGILSILKRNNNDLLGSGPLGDFYKYEGDSTWSHNPYGGCSSYYWKMEKDTINDFLYVGGDFNYVCTNPPLISYYIAMWDQFQWHSFGTNITSSVGTMQVYNGLLYAAIGADTLADGTQVNHVARWDWDTQTWYPLGSGFGPNSGPHDMEVFKDTLYMTGKFTIAGGDTAIGIARWYMPDTNCKYLRPMIHTLALQDTFNLWQGQVQVQFYNNNAYVQTWDWDFGDGNMDFVKNPVHTYTDTGTYNVTVTVTDSGCVKTAEKTIVVVSNMQTPEYSPDEINFNIYPNPTTGDVTAECNIPPGMNNAVIMVNDNFGSEKFRKELEPGFNKMNIRSSIWPAGWYIAGIYSNNRQVVVKKFVKE